MYRYSPMRINFRAGSWGYVPPIIFLPPNNWGTDDHSWPGGCGYLQKYTTNRPISLPDQKLKKNKRESPSAQTPTPQGCSQDVYCGRLNPHDQQGAKGHNLRPKGPKVAGGVLGTGQLAIYLSYGLKPSKPMPGYVPTALGQISNPTGDTPHFQGGPAARDDLLQQHYHLCCPYAVTQTQFQYFLGRGSASSRP